MGQSAGAIWFTDCISAEGKTPQMSIMAMTLD